MKFLTAFAPVFFLVTMPAATQDPTRDSARDPIGPRDYLLVQIEASRAVSPAVLPPVLQSQFERLGASELRKVFRDPPRGHRDPRAWERLGLGRWWHVGFGLERADLESLRETIVRLPGVERAELDRWVYPTLIPNDVEYSGQQWSLKPDRCDAEFAWDRITDSSKNVIVCVIDTGVEVSHSDLGVNLWVNPGEIPGNGIDDDGNGFIDDINGWDFFNSDATLEDLWPHGTGTNGIIGARGNNGLMISGINWGCQLMQGKMFGQSSGTWQTGAQATVYAVDNGAQVTNNSWGSTSPGLAIYVSALLYADSQDVLQIMSAGNEGNTKLFWPAAYPEALSVAATDANDLLASFSSHGDWIDMSAPGASVRSLQTGDSTGWVSGTSFSAPHVAGAAALMRAVSSSLTNRQLRRILVLTSDDLGAPGFDPDFGWGRLNIGRAVFWAGRATNVR